MILLKQQLCHNLISKNVVNHLATMVAFISDSSLIFQLFVSPLTKPAMMTNTSTSTLIEVKILLTEADSFTPNDSSPAVNKCQQ